MSDCLLISYNQADSETVDRLSRLLAERGIIICSLVEAGPTAWTRARAVAVCLGPHGWDPRQKQDVGRALAWQSQTESGGPCFPVIPVLLPAADLAPAFVFRHAWVDLSHDPADPRGLDRLVEAATAGTAPLRPIATIVDFCPYPGPHSFREEDAAFFWGREAVTERLLATVTRHNLVALVGPSASGKTSLLKAGLTSRLRQEMIASRPPPTVEMEQPMENVYHAVSLPDTSLAPDHGLAETEQTVPARQLVGSGGPLTPVSSEPEKLQIVKPAWVILSFTPGKRPFHHLAAALMELSAIDLPASERLPRVHRMGDRLIGGETALAQLIEQALNESGAERVLLVVDQFEELLTLTPEAERRPFVEMLLQAPVQPNVTLLLSLRADFYGEAIRLSPELSRLLEGSVINIGPLSGAELERAILKPARPVTLAFEPGLVERLGADVADAPDQMLLLQFTLVELWRQHQGGLLRHAFYDHIGQAQGAILYRSEQTFQTLTPAQQGLARRVLARLIPVKPDGLLSCQPVGLSQLASTLESDESESLHGVVEALAGAHLLGLGYDPVTDKLVVKAAHEALARRWPRWQTWLNEDREFWLWRQRLGESMAGWERAKPRQDQLLRGTALLEAERWLVQRREWLDSEGRVFIWQSLARWNWERDLRWLISLGMVLGLMVGLAILLAYQNSTLARLRQERNGALAAQAVAVATRHAVEMAHSVAETHRQKVEHEQQVTLSRLLAVQAQTMWAKELEPSTLLAIESLRRGPGVGGEQVLHHNLAFLPRPIAQIRLETEASALAFDPDDRRLVTASGRGAPRWWEAGSGRQIMPAGQDNGVTAAKLDLPQGEQLVEPASTEGQSRPPIVAFSPDGRWSASAAWDGTVRVWNVASGWQVAQLVLDDKITALAFGPTPRDEAAGQWLAVGGWNGRVRLWSLVVDPVIEHAGGVSIPEHPPLKPEQTVTVDAHRDVVLALTFSPDGQRLATGSADNTAKVWDLLMARSKGGLIPPALGGGVQEMARWVHGAGVWSVAFSPNGRWLATGSADRTARLWDISTGSGREIGRQVHRDDVKKVLFSPNGLWVATVDNDHTVHVWPVASGGAGQLTNRDKAAQMSHAGEINDLVFSPDSRWLATTSADHTARIWETATGREIARMRHDDEVMAVAFSPVMMGQAQRRWVATSGRDGLTRIWEMTSGEEVTQLPQPDWVLGLQFSPEHDWLAVYSRRIVRVWAMNTGQLATEMGHQDWIISASFSPDGYWLATGSRDKTARMWQVDTGQEVGLMKHAGPVHLVMFSPTGRQLATASSDNIVRLWQTGTSQRSGTAVGPRVIQLPHSRWVNAVAFSPDGRWLATASRDYKARIWETHTGRELSQLSHMDGVLDVVFSPGGRWLATASADHTARLWDVTTNREVTRLPHDRRVEAVLFSSDGRWLATRSGKEVLVWEVTQLLNTGLAADQHAARLMHPESVRAMAFSPDGQWLATTTGNPPGTGAVHLWETATGQEISGTAYDNWVHAVAFSPDGHWLVHGGGDRLAQVWLLQPQDLIDEACTRLTRNLTRSEWQQYLGGESYRPTCPNLPIPEG